MNPNHLTLDDIREMCGHIEDGSHVSLLIGQDECTKAWHVTVGKITYTGRTMAEALAHCKDGDTSIPPGL